MWLPTREIFRPPSGKIYKGKPKVKKVAHLFLKVDQKGRQSKGFGQIISCHAQFPMLLFYLCVSSSLHLGCSTQCQFVIFFLAKSSIYMKLSTIGGHPQTTCRDFLDIFDPFMNDFNKYDWYSSMDFRLTPSFLHRPRGLWMTLSTTNYLIVFQNFKKKCIPLENRNHNLKGNK